MSERCVCFACLGERVAVNRFVDVSGSVLPSMICDKCGVKPWLLYGLDETATPRTA